MTQSVERTKPNFGARCLAALGLRDVVQPVPNMATKSARLVPAPVHRQLNRFHDDGHLLRRGVATGAAGLGGGPATDWAPEHHPPEKHAQMLLDWLQGDNGITGELYIAEVNRMYREACVWHGWHDAPWVMVAGQFAKLTGGKAYI